MTHLIDRIARQVTDGARLSEADALALFESPELAAIGELADQVNRAKNHDVVFYNVNRHINPTNICALSCKFCAYSRKPGEEGGYAYSIDEMVTKAGEAVAAGATEVHMVGGLHPRWPYAHYRDMIAAIHQAYPQLHLKAFTAVELDWLARKARKSIREVLEELRAVGLGSLPGGGAEIFHPEIRDAICDTKVSAEQWLETHQTAHALGMRSNCTMLYGHIETYAHRVDHMRRLRDLQDVSRGFNAFIPLAFQPFQNEMGIDRYTFGYDDLKTVAVARLFLDNFQHIKAYWVMLGQDVAQLALTFGANDLDGTVIEEKISRMAGGRAGMAMTRGFLDTLIRKARRLPCERDTLYRPLGAAATAGTSQHIPAAMPAPIPIDTPAAMSTLTGASPDAGAQLDELLRLARHTSLHELGRLATAVTSQSGEASCAPTVVLPFANLTTPGDAIELASQVISDCRERYKLTPTAITIDLSLPCVAPRLAAEALGSRNRALPVVNMPHDETDDEAHDSGLLLETLFALRHTFPDAQLSLAGFKSLWRLAQCTGVEVEELITRLVEAGVDQIESGANETESDLTDTETVDLHLRVHELELGGADLGDVDVRAANRPGLRDHGRDSRRNSDDSEHRRDERGGPSGLATVARVELSAPAAEAKGATEPMWESFVRRVLAFARLHDTTGGVVGLSVEVSPGSFVSTTEYLRAVAIARLGAGRIPLVMAPLARIPTVSQVDGLGASRVQHPAEKVAAIALHYGAEDLGPIDPQRFSPVAVLQQIRAAGFAPRCRDAAFGKRSELGENARSEPMAPELSTIRHRPGLAAAPAGSFP